MAQQVRKYKKDLDYSYTLGVFPTMELLNHKPGSALKIYISSRGERNSGIAEILEICRRQNIDFEVNDRLIDRLSPKENCYAMGVFRKFQAELSRDKSHLVLVNPGDMGNIGTIIRTMLGFYMDNLALIRPAVDIFNPRVIRSSMGSVFRISFQYFDTIDQYTRAFSNNLYAFMTNGKTALDKTPFRKPFSIIFGNESSGLPERYLGLGTSVKIPHSEDIDSLNLPVSVGISLYEISKK